MIVVQNLLGLPDDTPNPAPVVRPEDDAGGRAGRWPRTSSALDPADAAYFQANLAKFDSSLTPWLNAIAAFKAKYAGTPVATTEPVADYLLDGDGHQATSRRSRSRRTS